jgi:enoyl-CoA hydratase/carnithine racemase
MEGPGKNALGTPLLERLSVALTEARGAPLLLTGAGDAFSAGLDLKEVASLEVHEMEIFLRRLTRVVEQLFRDPGPTVAAVGGHAIAGGCILAAACDWRIATTEPRARIGVNEVAMGLRFPPGILEVLRYRVPRLESAVLGSALHSPSEALALGLVDELSPDVMPRARAVLSTLSAHPREAYAAAKHDLRSVVPPWNEEAERRFVSEVLPVWTGEELKQRIRAFLERKSG